MQKMKRGGLVERGAVSGEETRVTGREQDFDLRQARDSPDNTAMRSRESERPRQSQGHYQAPPAPQTPEPSASYREETPTRHDPVSPQREETGTYRPAPQDQTAGTYPPTEQRQSDGGYQTEHDSSGQRPAPEPTGQPAPAPSSRQHGTAYQQRFAPDPSASQEPAAYTQERSQAFRADVPADGHPLTPTPQDRQAEAAHDSSRFQEDHTRFSADGGQAPASGQRKGRAYQQRASPDPVIPQPAEAPAEAPEQPSKLRFEGAPQPSEQPSQAKPPTSGQQTGRLRANRSRLLEDGPEPAKGPASPRQHGTKYQRRFSEDAESPQAADGGATSAPKGAGSSVDQPRRASKLNFTADELPPEPPGKKLTKARRKAERTAEKLEAAEKSLPARRKLRISAESDAETGKTKRRLKFEKEVKSQQAHVKGALPLRPVKAGANAAIGFAHRKISQVEHENVGTEAAHRTELVGESGLRTLYYRKKTAPYRKVSRLQKKSARAGANAAYQQVLQDNPQLQKNMLARMWQKQKIKRQYAKAAREAQKAGKKVKDTAVTTEKITEQVAAFVKRHPVLFGAIGALLLLFILISSLLSSCSSMSTGGLGILTASSYTAEDQDIDNAELSYTEWETDLQLQVQRAESDHPGYDEYRYQVDDIGHNPYELMSYLTAAYQGFRYSDVESTLRAIFAEQYTLTFTEEIEIRYRTETYTDPETGEEYEEEVPYEWHILNVNLSALSFTDVIAGRLTEDQKQIYTILMQTKGNRQYVGNVFGDVNWLPYVTSYYGYRVHPITGQKNYHKGVDIGMPQGTEILAGHDGVVTQAGDAGSYGLVVVLEGELSGGKTLTTKYAHCSQLLVSAGQEVKAGDVIAKVGSTGDSTGPHLHLEVLVNGSYLNPLYFAATGDHNAGNALPGTPGGPEIPAYPGEPMGDGSFAALMEEAQKHLGKPYVFGASGPNSFDCSGFVCYVLNQSGVASVGRTTAQGLYNMCTPVSRENAQPGDLIFFTGTYSSGSPVSHIGIYIGNGMMIHAGSPVQYASINTSYWTQHFYAFGRLP